MKLINWFKKNTFYKVLVIAVVLALAGYAVWFFQPMPLIPEGAENIQIDHTTYSSDNVEPTQVQVVFSKWDDSYQRQITHLIDLTDEGSQKLIDLLKTQKIRAMWNSTGDLGRSKGEISFGVRFEHNGIGYLKWISTWKDINVTNNWYEIEKGARPELGPAANHLTKITGNKEADDFYAAALDIIENYAATDRVITPPETE